MTNEPRIYKKPPHWLDEMPDKIVVASSDDAVRMIDAAPEHAEQIFTAPVKPGTAFVIDVAKIMEIGSFKKDPFEIGP